MKIIFVLFISFIMIGCRSLILYHPYKTIYYVPSQIGLKYEDVYFVTTDNVKLNAWYIKSKENFGTVIFCHGNAGNISTWLNMIRVINSLGFNLFIFDYRGYGKSEGTPTFEGLKIDSIAAWDFVVENLKEKPQRIIIWGRSLGGSVAAYLASQKKGKILIVESTFVSFKKEVNHFCFFCSYLFFVDQNEFNTLAYLNESKCPILIIHSMDDEIIPYKQGQELFEQTKKTREFLSIEGPHNIGFMTSGDQYLKGIQNFLDKYYFN